MSTIKYRTKDGTADYSFSFERQPSGDWRAFVLSQPSYGGRDESPLIIHRLSDGGRKFVCWKGRLSSESDARAVAAEWANATQQYIRTGRRF